MSVHTTLLRERFGEPNRAYRIAAERLTVARAIARATTASAADVLRVLPEDPRHDEHLAALAESIGGGA